MTPFPPMPSSPAAPVKPHVLRGILTDSCANDVSSNIGVIAINETHAGNQRDTIRIGGEILFNLANISAGESGDVVRIQCIDNKGNGDVWKVSIGSDGVTDISKVIRKINGAEKRVDKFTLRSMVK